MIVIKNVFGGSRVYIKNVFANAENIVVVYNGGEPIEVTGGGSGSGDVVGPSSATDNAIARFNLTTGKLIQNSGATIDDSGNITANNLSGTNTGDQDLSGYSLVGHSHAIADVTGLQTALDGKAASSHSHVIADVTGLQTALDGKQASLVSGTNIKTVNSTTLLGSGDVTVQATLVSGTNIKTVNGTTLLGSGDLVISAGLSTSIDILTQQALGGNTKAQTFDVNLGNNSNTRAGADNRIDYYAIYIPSAQTITGVHWLQAVQGSYTGDNYNGWGLYSYSGGTFTLVASTTNDTEIWKGTANTAQSKAFSSTYAASAGVYFIAFLYCQSAQTTAPTIYAKPSTPTGIAGLLTNSANLAFSQIGQTSLPASVAASSLTVSSIQSWVGLY